jgi:hypothetical protein
MCASERNQGGHASKLKYRFMGHAREKAVPCASVSIASFSINPSRTGQDHDYQTPRFEKHVSHHRRRFLLGHFE